MAETDAQRLERMVKQRQAWGPDTGNNDIKWLLGQAAHALELRAALEELVSAWVRGDWYNDPVIDAAHRALEQKE